MRFLQIEWKMNVPNALSLARIAMLPLFVVLYQKDAVYWAFGTLVLSGITDSLDGIIARRFNQITELGKLLDPIADKLTQVTVVICLALRHPPVVYLMAICLVKELCQALGGLILLHRGESVQGARWYGKVSTTVFYGVMAIIVVWTDIPQWLLVGLVAIVALLMLFAFFKYMAIFFRIKKTIPKREEQPIEDPTGSAGSV